MTFKRTAIAAIAGALLALPAGASAESVNIGSPLDRTHNFAPGFCGAGCTMVQHTQTALATNHSLNAPANGAVTAWAVRSGQIGSTYRLRVLRPTGGFSFTFAGTSAVSPPVPDSMDLVRSYAASVPIQQGDKIGLEVVDGAGPPMHTGAPLTLADVIAYFPTTANDGTTQTFSEQPQPNAYEILVRATISFCRVPDVAGLKRDAALAALTAAECGVATKKKKLKRTKKNRKKKGRVLRQLTAPGTTVAPGTPVDLRIAGLKPRPKPKPKN